MALQAWAADRGTDPGLVTEPLLFALMFFSFALFRATDVAVRLGPVVAGCLLVASPLLLRRQLGRLATLLAMLFLATSPTMVYYSRHADSATLAGLCAVAAVALGSRLVVQSSTRQVAQTGIVVGLLFAGGPNAFYIVLPLAIYLGVGRFVADASTPTRLDWLFPDVELARRSAEGEDTGRGRSVITRVLLLAAATWAIASTAWLFNPAGLQGAVESIGLWLSGVTTPGPVSPLVFVIGLVSYEPLLLLLGIEAAAVVVTRRNALGTLMLWWAGFVLVVASASGQRPAPALVAIVVPLALLAAIAAAGIIEAIDWSREARRVAYFGLGATILVSNLMVATNHITTPDPFVPEYLALVSLALLAVGGGVAVWLLGAGTAARYASVALVVGFWLFGLHTATLLSYRLPANPAELPVGSASMPDVRTLGSDVEEVIGNLNQVNGNPSRLPTDVTIDPAFGPLVRWYVRDNALVKPAASDSTRPAIYIGPAGSKAPRGSYVGQRYVIALGPDASPMTWKGVWRWFVFRESSGPPQPLEAVVYVRTSTDRR